MRVYIGVDIGSVSIDVAIVSENDRLLADQYIRHNGRIDASLSAVIQGIEQQYEIIAMAATGVGAPRAVAKFGATAVNEVIALVQGVTCQNPDARTIIDIGGQDSKLIFLEENISGKSDQLVLRDFSMNSFCAAGTGSFLDQQAARLYLTIEEFAQQALVSNNPARVAGRCSVFAKSDMIHLQQKGTSTEDIVAGLCHAVAGNFKANIAKGKELSPPVIFTGGVSQNPGVLRAFRTAFSLSEGQLYVPVQAVTLGAYGAVQWLLNNTARIAAHRNAGTEKAKQENSASERKQLAPLKPAEARITRNKFSDKPQLPREPLFLGIDIGSISTNIVLLSLTGEVVFKRYLMTAGQPIEAVRSGLRQLYERYGQDLFITGVATTGSGRMLIGDLLGADVIKNEITTHARAAIFVNPQVDTIFEIGGQDSKYIHLTNGIVDDFTMNKACAAGTGSFLEEQAQKLGVQIKEEFGRLALSAARPLDCGEKCTVFMESEVVKYFQEGGSIAEITAGLAYSVVHNYLYKVVENRPIGSCIFFQGGVAANAAVVAAFEAVTGKAVYVPEHYEVMGALGCCLLAREHYLANPAVKSRFKGLDYLERPFKTDTFECRNCDNLCEINRIAMEGNQLLYYGGRCERYEVAARTEINSMPDYFAAREELLGGQTPEVDNKRIIGIPRTQVFYEYFPFFKTFFETLGFAVKVTPESNRDAIKRGIDSVRTTTCYPAKLAHGHVSWMVDQARRGGIDALFIPSLRETQSCSPSHHPMANHCDFIVFIAEMTNEALHIERQGIPVLKPELHFRLGPEAVKRELYNMMLTMGMGCYSEQSVDAACNAAFEQYYKFRRTMLEQGRAALSRIAPTDKAVILIGKLHNTCDKVLTLNLPKIWRGLGVHCLPMDFFDFYSSEDVHAAWYNTTLAMGQRMLALSDIVRDIPNVYPVYVTNFSCVNDSMMSHFIKSELGGKPALYLEIDEHSGEAGIITRCEAFLDAISGKADTTAYYPDRIQRRSFDRKAVKTLYIPYVAKGSRIWSAAFRRCGINAESLPEPDQESIAYGQQFTTGEECYPCILITGDIFKKIISSRGEPGMAFFSPGSCGSCRYDSFNPLHNIALKKLMQTGGAGDAVIVDDYGPANPQFKEIVASPLYRAAIMEAFIALDTLNRLLLNIRPYECQAGMAERAFEAGIDAVGHTLETGGDFAGALHKAVAAMLAVPVDRTIRRPRIGVMGEAYIRNVGFSSNNLIQTLEALGAEVVTPPVHELIKYTRYKNIYYAEKAGDSVQARTARLTNQQIDNQEEKYLRPVIEHLGYNFEPCMLTHIQKSGMTLKAGSHIGAAIEMINYKADGIINAIPFNCVPGMVIESLMERFRSEYPNIPFLTLVFQGQNQANNLTRLETLVHQCQEKIKEEQKVAL
ncbi:MAG TPA: acyl-CoA dehydratase activase [Methylomusa anaerophila]|uniref:R-phenyllactate dehydratase activator n=1 Tax=Methylomusa anaerophila TaxID=1930071 RepID=A0A348AEF1_9FIRM|nr:acyl-CoA dehydratase activase [Methylomusa anaerophila]BBB89449.1 R-phenyllactate dehydratase activator [Methylomusa anaerophila]HML89682.1 acyl-CoA dehydratase activase [Methylomusa anaerophila]